MAKVNQTFFHRIEVNKETLAQGEVTRRGETMVEAVKGWLEETGWKAGEKPVPSSGVLGRRIPYFLIELNSLENTEISVTVIPLVDGKIQCSTCGHPHDDPDFYCLGQCREWRMEQKPKFDVDDLLGAFDASGT